MATGTRAPASAPTGRTHPPAASTTTGAVIVRRPVSTPVTRPPGNENPGDRLVLRHLHAAPPAGRHARSDQAVGSSMYTSSGHHSAKSAPFGR